MVNEVELAELAITWPAPSKIRWPTNGNGWNVSVAPGALPVVVPLVPVLVPVVPVVPDVPLLGLGMLLNPAALAQTCQATNASLNGAYGYAAVLFIHFLPLLFL